MNICVVGTGYVGLVAGTCLSDFGMHVTCVDKDEHKIAMLKEGKSPIYEMGLSELISRNMKLGRLHFSTNLEEAVDRSLVVFIGVGTPEGPDGRADLSYVHEVAKTVAETMNDYKVIVIKSTVPVGTSKELRKIIKQHQQREIEFDIVSNPEFLREGSAVEDFMRPNRVVIGSDSDRALAIMRDIYRPLYLLETPIVGTDNETAELIKYAANTALAMKISFINEIANICDRVGADVFRVAVAVGMDKRIGSKFLHPGPGFGGSCFPKDVNSIIRIADDHGYDFRLARATMEVNQQQRENVFKRAVGALGDPNGKTVAILGLAFKPNTDDVREAPALYVAERLIAEGAKVQAYDPVAMEEAAKNVKGIKYCKDAYSACEGADLVMLLTEWNEFRDLDFERIKKVLKSPSIYDTRNIYDPKNVRKMGYTYISTGRP